MKIFKIFPDILVKNSISVDNIKSRDSSVGIATGYVLNDQYSGFRFPTGKRLGIFFFSTAFRPAWGPPIFLSNGHREFLSRGLKRPGHETDHSPSSSAEIKERVELYLHSPICLHGVVLS
jgi:hypothetical protein